MKKKYSKPDIMFESFAVSTSIAATCVTRTYEQFACAVEFSHAPGKTVFAEEGICEIVVTPDVDGDFQWGEFCYHVPGGNPSFNS